MQHYATISLERGTHFGHGAGRGVDEWAGRAAWANGLYVVAFLPGVRWEEYLAPHPETWCHEVRQTGKDPTGRDRDLAEWCDVLRAFPLHEEERSVRSGTWTTIRMAIQMGKHVTVYVLRPADDGPPLVQIARPHQQLATVARIAA